MFGIKSNQLTKEIEIKGSESFIEANFDMIEDRLIGSLEVVKAEGSTKTESNDRPILWVDTVEPHLTEAIRIPAVVEISGNTMTTKQEVLEASQEPKAKRPPVRKYFNTLGKLIRSEDTSISKNPVVSVIEQRPTEVSITSLKEKFGLPESKIGEVIREAERQGKIKKIMNGSYVWAQD